MGFRKKAAKEAISISGGAAIPGVIFWTALADTSAAGITAALAAIGLGLGMIVGVCVLIGGGLLSYAGFRYLTEKIWPGP
jgi:hypothetical protein